MKPCLHFTGNSGQDCRVISPVKDIFQEDRSAPLAAGDIAPEAFWEQIELRPFGFTESLVLSLI